jgi:hypothetical protein
MSNARLCITRDFTDVTTGLRKPYYGTGLHL